MKRICTFLLTLLLLCLCAGCASSQKQETVVTPPSRIGAETYLVKDPRTVSCLEDAYRQADVVARVRVGSWLGDTGDYPYGDWTYFEADAVRTYKGQLPEAFVFVQEGTAKKTREGYPLFTCGDELLAFLFPFGPFERANDMPYWKNAYANIGSPYSDLYAAYDEAGNVYYLARDLLFADRTDIPNYRNEDPALCDELLKELTARDPIFTKLDLPFQKIFAEADMEQLFKRIAG